MVNCQSINCKSQTVPNIKVLLFLPIQNIIRWQKYYNYQLDCSSNTILKLFMLGKYCHYISYQHPLPHPYTHSSLLSQAQDPYRHGEHSPHPKLNIHLVMGSSHHTTPHHRPNTHLVMGSTQNPCQTTPHHGRGDSLLVVENSQLTYEYVHLHHDQAGHRT